MTVGNVEFATRRWLDAAPSLPALTEQPEMVAERLMLLLHYGVDWDSWLGQRRHRYWDHHLPDEVRSATYRAGSSLDRWWSIVSERLCSTPSSSQRDEVVFLLREDPRPVLSVLRTSTPALVLRTRYVAERVRDGRRAESESTSLGMDSSEGRSR